MTSDIKKKYIRTFSGLIWKIVFDNNELVLGIEVRDESALRQDYFIIKLTEKVDLQINKPTQISWWSSLIRISGSHIYIINYKDKKNPAPGELMLYNFSSDHFEPPVANFILIKNDPSELFGTSEGKELSFKNPSRGQNVDIHYPEYFDSGNIKFPIFADFLNGLGIQNISSVEYAELIDQDLAILAYSKQFGRQKDRFLILLKNGELILHQQIDEMMNGEAPNSFVILGNNLIFVENRKTINVYAW